MNKLIRKYQSGSYVVKPRDSLRLISKNLYGTSEHANYLAKLNNIK